jgi:hypothetical protein
MLAAINASEEQSQYLGQFYEEYYARLRSYFQLQLGDASEADDCVQETLRHFFFFMKDRCWEAEVKLINFRLRMIAGGVCSKKLAKKRARLANGSGRQEKESLLDKIMREVLWPIRSRMEFKQMFIKMFGNVRQPRLKQLSALR